MARIVFIGAGSFGFTRGLVRDILTFPLLRDAEIVLMDINKERLDFAKTAVTRIIEAGNYPATMEVTMDRRKALKGADAVLITILAGGVNVWKHDILIPKKYGIDTCVGDTRGPSGIFRALRTIPEMLAICRDMEELCPNAILLNYSNPMAMLCHAMQRESFIPFAFPSRRRRVSSFFFPSWSPSAAIGHLNRDKRHCPARVDGRHDLLCPLS